MAVVEQSGRYEVLNALGRGGFGTVYRARYIGEGGFAKQVAIKVMNPDVSDDEELASRLRDEARMLGLIRHRAVVQVDGLVLLNGRWTVVMEYVEGVDLRSLLAMGAIPVGPALEIVGEVAGALHTAWHSAGPEGRPLHLMHRDIKPSNIQVTPMGEVKVLDFGIARAEFGNREAQTRAYALGTAEYMSPERLDFIEHPAGDVYALGVLLYEMLTGMRFGRTSANEARHTQKFFDARARLWGATGSQEIIQFVGGMLAFDPDQRPTARDVERVAASLRQRTGGEFLRDWAERAVPATRAAAPEARGELSGAVLQTGAISARTMAEPAPAPTPASPRRWPMLVGLVFALILSIATLLGAIFSKTGTVEGAVRDAPSAEEVQLAPPEGTSGDEESPAEAAGGEANEVEALEGEAIEEDAAQPEGDVELEEGAAAEPAAPNDADPAAGGSAASEGSAAPEGGAAPAAERAQPAAERAQPAAERPAPAEPEQPAELGRTWVSLEGEITSVFLASGTERYPLPGLVPAGVWSIEANFPGTGMMGAGSVTLAGESKLLIECSEAFTRCKVR